MNTKFWYVLTGVFYALFLGTVGALGGTLLWIGVFGISLFGGVPAHASVSIPAFIIFGILAGIGTAIIIARGLWKKSEREERLTEQERLVRAHRSVKTSALIMTVGLLVIGLIFFSRDIRLQKDHRESLETASNYCLFTNTLHTASVQIMPLRDNSGFDAVITPSGSRSGTYDAVLAITNPGYGTIYTTTQSVTLDNENQKFTIFVPYNDLGLSYYKKITVPGSNARVHMQGEFKGTLALAPKLTTNERNYIGNSANDCPGNKNQARVTDFTSTTEFKAAVNLVIDGKNVSVENAITPPPTNYPSYIILAKRTEDGGLCASYQGCAASLIVYENGTYEYKQDDKMTTGQLSRPEIESLVGYVRNTKAAEIRKHPFTELCPRAYDGTEITYLLSTTQETAELKTCSYQINQNTEPFKTLNELARKAAAQITNQ